MEFSRISAGGSPSFGLGFELGFQFADDRARGARLSGGGTGNLDLFQSEFYAGLRAQAGEGSLTPLPGRRRHLDHQRHAGDLGRAPGTREQQ